MKDIGKQATAASQERCLMLTYFGKVPGFDLHLLPDMTEKMAMIKLVMHILQRRISLFWEEIGACAAVHMRYVMDACNHVQFIILLPPMMGMPFMLVTLTRLIVTEPKR